MPRWASRITLAVESIRVERLHDITEEDAKAEGCDAVGDWSAAPPGEDGLGFVAPLRYRAGFRVLWDSISGRRPGCSWADNPWVWRVQFRRETPGEPMRLLLEQDGWATKSALDAAREEGRAEPVAAELGKPCARRDCAKARGDAAEAVRKALNDAADWYEQRSIAVDVGLHGGPLVDESRAYHEVALALRKRAAR
jgi:hypothetical protein